MSKKQINNQRFSIRFVHISTGLGFKTVGRFEKFLKNLNPNTRIGVGVASLRVYRLLREIEAWKMQGGE